MSILSTFSTIIVQLPHTQGGLADLIVMASAVMDSAQQCSRRGVFRAKTEKVASIALFHWG